MMDSPAVDGFVLPPGWRWSTVGEVGEVRLGRQRSPSNRSNLYPTKYIRAANITWGGLDLTEVLDMDFTPAEREVYRLQPGDVLLAEASGSADEVGRPVAWREEIENCCFQNTVIRFRPRCVLPGYAQVVFSHFVRSGVFANASKGVGIQHLSADRFSQLRFPLPPLNEQSRIVAKADELLSDLDAGVFALKRAQGSLKKYRAAVLKAAVAGGLTAEWRAAHPNVEPATKLLDRILAERRRKWEVSQQAKFAASGTAPPRGWQSKYPAPPSLDATDLTELPAGWCWARANQVGEVQLGRQRSPKHHHGPYMRPYLRVANVFENRIDVDDVLQMNFTPAECEVYRLEFGDILLNEGQSLHLVGRPAMYRDEVPGACFQNTLVRFRAAPGLLPKFALYVFLAYLHNKRFQKIARWTVNIAHLGADRFSNIELPLPPVDEQQEIVAEVEQQLSDIEATDNYIVACLKRAARLRQSILKEAFSGRLVPQDPTDEPASVLLDRIRQAKNGSAAATRSRGRRKTADGPTLFE